MCACGQTWKYTSPRCTSNSWATSGLYIVFRLKQAGDEITGTAGPDAAHQSAIRDAKLVADHLTFSVTGADESGKAGAGPTWKFDLKVAGDHMEGKAEGAYGGRNLGTTNVLMSRQE